MLNRPNECTKGIRDLEIPDAASYGSCGAIIGITDEVLSEGRQFLEDDAFVELARDAVQRISLCQIPELP